MTDVSALDAAIRTGATSQLVSVLGLREKVYAACDADRNGSRQCSSMRRSVNAMMDHLNEIIMFNRESTEPFTVEQQTQHIQYISSMAAEKDRFNDFLHADEVARIRVSKVRMALCFICLFIALVLVIIANAVLF